MLSRSSVQITDFVTRHDQPGEGCFTCVATIQNKATRRAEKTVAQIVCLHTEIDFRQIQETPEAAERVVAGLSPPPSRAHHSGHGLHLYWFLKISIAATPEANARHKQLLRRVANHLGGDQAACLVHQLLRLPGTTNSKKGEQLPVRTLIDRPDRRYDYAELEKLDRDRGCASAASQGRRSHGRQRREPGQPVPGVRGEIRRRRAARRRPDVRPRDRLSRPRFAADNADDTLAALHRRHAHAAARAARPWSRAALTALQAAAARSGLALDLARERCTSRRCAGAG